MVSDVMKRTERLDLARQILRAKVTAAGNDASAFTPLDYTKAARIYLSYIRHNTPRLKAELKKLNARAEHKPSI